MFIMEAMNVLSQSSGHGVCPWWLGPVLASPLRRLFLDPKALLAPFVREGMTALEPGPGMGYFTLELARLVGSTGRVVAVDIQPKMITGLRRRAERAGLLGRIDARLAQAEGMGAGDLTGRTDFVLAFAMVHELPDAAAFFREASLALKPGGKLLLSEPSGHVSEAAFARTLELAEKAGLEIESRPSIRSDHSALLVKKP